MNLVCNMYVKLKMNEWNEKIIFILFIVVHVPVLVRIQASSNIYLFIIFIKLLPLDGTNYYLHRTCTQACLLSSCLMLPIA